MVLFFQRSQKTTATGPAIPAPSRCPLATSGSNAEGIFPNSVCPPDPIFREAASWGHFWGFMIYLSTKLKWGHHQFARSSLLNKLPPQLPGTFSECQLLPTFKPQGPFHRSRGSLLGLNFIKTYLQFTAKPSIFTSELHIHNTHRSLMG